ncbi:polysaccharide deacetylase family protein [Desulfitobacterium sp. Sab5]|uniref:polysaccharide deacetylase family protein n=1 Tax=Desulfitobacterium nosdiversum TaxID=3375356 RepID=UPI003CF41850
MKLLIISKQKIVLAGFLVLIIIISIYIWKIKSKTSLVLSETYFMAHTEKKVAALTFDDGPDPPFTEPILNILKQKGVKATFFVIGENAKQNPAFIKRIVQDGHEIGNHSYTHNNNQSKMLSEIRKTDEVVFTETGVHTHFYRPPGGYASKGVIAAIKKQEYIFTLWSVDSKDWRRPGVNRIMNNVMSKMSPGAIVLFHDGGGYRSQTVEALGKIIDTLRSEGYSFVTLSELKALDTVPDNKVFPLK